MAFFVAGFRGPQWGPVPPAERQGSRPRQTSTGRRFGPKADAICDIHIDLLQQQGQKSMSASVPVDLADVEDSRTTAASIWQPHCWHVLLVQGHASRSDLVQVLCSLLLYTLRTNIKRAGQTRGPEGRFRGGQTQGLGRIGRVERWDLALRTLGSLEALTSMRLPGRGAECAVGAMSLTLLVDLTKFCAIIVSSEALQRESCKDIAGSCGYWSDTLPRLASNSDAKRAGMGTGPDIDCRRPTARLRSITSWPVPAAVCHGEYGVV